MRHSPFPRILFYLFELGKEVIPLGFTARRRAMAWCRIQLTEDERRIVNEERASHPSLSTSRISEFLRW